ncbi:threonine aldolase family protein [Vibrio chagasii]|nr:threonine aldolase family protein [Vibrio chagasii]
MHIEIAQHFDSMTICLSKGLVLSWLSAVIW